MSTSQEKLSTFTRIMGSTMPPDESPEYEMWLFEQSWNAALQKAAEIAEKRGKVLTKIHYSGSPLAYAGEVLEEIAREIRALME